MSRLIVVSNRLPVRVKVKGRELKIEPSVGGLATGLSAFYKRYDGVWIGWPGVAYEMIRDVKDDVEIELKKMGCYPVLLSQRQIEHYYHGFCNKTIWPLFHYFLQFTVYDKRFYDEYKNAFPMSIDYDRFANALRDSKVKSEIDRIRRKSKGCKRLDYTKGIPQRLKAFDLFLERYPEFRE